MSRDLLGGTWAGMTGERPSSYVNSGLLPDTSESVG